jgi:hypothetical protein
MLPSHYCVPAIIEGVFLPRDSIPRIGIRSRQKWERISSRFMLDVRATFGHEDEQSFSVSVGLNQRGGWMMMNF